MKKWVDMTSEEQRKIWRDQKRGMKIEKSYYGKEWFDTDLIGQGNLYYRSVDRIVEELVIADTKILGTIIFKNGKPLPGTMKLKKEYE